MNPEYVDIFRLRGHPYHAAMLAQPHARDAEFDALFAANPLRDGERILDIPAGGGYLGRHLGDRAQVQARELSHGFSEGIEVVSPDELPGLRGFDRAVCLAALHHFDDAIGFLAQLRGTLAPGGLLHVADVAAGSPLCDFLDG
ncbi:MAG TPA: methyltransferase domain-containing protein, partial [Dongiaceae bacterium]